MKKITLAIFLMVYSFGIAQEFPLNFGLPAQLMNGVGGASTSFVPDPAAPTNQVLQVVGNGELYDTAQLTLAQNINLSDDANNTITFRVRPAADYGTRTHLLKFETQGPGGGAASTELSFTTTGTAWQNISLNFPSGLGNYALMVIFPDFNNANVGTYLFDDFAGATNSAAVVAFPFNFNPSAQLFLGVGNATTSLVVDPALATNQVMRVVGSGDLYDTAQRPLTLNLNLADDANNTITFKVRPAADYGTRTHLLKFESPGAGGGAAQTELPFTTTGTAWQTITLNFGTGLGNYGLVVLFPDFNNAAVGTYFFDDFAGGTNVTPPPPVTGPTVNSPTPPVRLPANVISIYSDAYTSITPITLDAGWCGANSVQATTAGGAGNNVLAYKNNACQGITFPTATQNLIGFTNIHVDLFVATGTNIVGKVFNLKTVATTGGAAGEVEVPIDLGALSPAIVPGEWYSFDKVYTAGQLAALAANPTMKEFGITSNLNNSVWYDNLYLWRAPLNTNEFSANSIKLYPNPASNVLNIESAMTIEKVSVYNLLGQEVISQSPNTELITLDVANLQVGVYVVRTSINGTVSSTRFIKE